MKDPKEQPGKPDDLDLDEETTADLEVPEEEGKEVRGGYTGACGNQSNNCCTHVN